MDKLLGLFTQLSKVRWPRCQICDKLSQSQSCKSQYQLLSPNRMKSTINTNFYCRFGLCPNTFTGSCPLSEKRFVLAQVVGELSPLLISYKSIDVFLGCIPDAVGSAFESESTTLKYYSSCFWPNSKLSATKSPIFTSWLAMFTWINCYITKLFQNWA